MDSVTLHRIDSRTKWTLGFFIVSVAVMMGVVIGMSYALSPIKVRQRDYERLTTDAIVSILDYEASDSLDTPKDREAKKRLLIQIRDQLTRRQLQ